MISKKNIETIFADCNDLGYSVDYKDILYCLIKDKFEDPSVAYVCVFGGSEEVAKHQSTLYEGLSKMTFLSAHLAMYNKTAPKKRSKSEPMITYDENLAYMLELKEETKQAKRDGDIEVKDALKILTDITVKINDRFKVNDDNKNQVVVVETKYNDVCEYCQHEVARAPITKEEAIAMYDLIEKK